MRFDGRAVIDVAHSPYPIDVPANIGPHATFVGDLDGDGDDDLALAVAPRGVEHLLLYLRDKMCVVALKATRSRGTTPSTNRPAATALVPFATLRITKKLTTTDCYEISRELLCISESNGTAGQHAHNFCVARVM